MTSGHQVQNLKAPVTIFIQGDNHDKNVKNILDDEDIILKPQDDLHYDHKSMDKKLYKNLQDCKSSLKQVSCK